MVIAQDAEAVRPDVIAGGRSGLAAINGLWVSRRGLNRHSAPEAAPWPSVVRFPGNFLWQISSGRLAWNACHSTEARMARWLLRMRAKSSGEGTSLGFTINLKKW
jgi:hypothetical protein